MALAPTPPRLLSAFLPTDHATPASPVPHCGAWVGVPSPEGRRKKAATPRTRPRPVSRTDRRWGRSCDLSGAPGLAPGWGCLVWLGTAACPPRTCSSPANTRTWLPARPAHKAIITPLAGDSWGGPGWASLYIPYQPQVLILAGFVFILIFFCFDFFKIRIFILSTFILKEFVLCIGGSWIQSWGCGSWGRGVAHRGSCSPAHSSRPPALPLLFSSLFSLKL